MNPTDEAAQIFLRMFEALARRSGKTLNARSKEDIRQVRINGESMLNQCSINDGLLE